MAVTKGILPYKMHAAGENFCGFKRYKGHFPLQNARRRRFFVVSERYKGDFALQNARRRRFFVVSGRYKGDFPLQNERRRRKFCGFRALLGGFCVEKYDDILPKRERRGPKFPVLAKIPRSQISLIS